MEIIHKPGDYPCSDNFDLKKHFTEYSRSCGFQLETDNRLTALFCIRRIFEEQKRKESSSSCSFDVLAGSEQCPSKTEPSTNTSSARTIEPNMKKGSEFSVSIRIYKPLELPRVFYINLQVGSELVLLGSNTLADLRDHIVCPIERGLCKQATNSLSSTTAIETVKGKDPSGFLFIDNVFYNDTRHEGWKDYSKNIRDWTKGIFMDITTGCLETTRIDELKPRFGYPYVYKHLGNCEHIFTFSDASLVTGPGSMNTKYYPYCKGYSRPPSKHCNKCSKRTCERIPFTCQSCLVKQHQPCKELLQMYPYFPVVTIYS